VYKGVACLVLTSLVISLSILGYREMARRWERTLEAIAHLNKLEELVGLRSVRPEKRKVFEKDDYLFQRYFDKTQRFQTEEQFIKKNMNKRNMFKHMRRVYWALAIAGAFLILFAAVLIVIISFFPGSNIL
jgi:hypothetical protein